MVEKSHSFASAKGDSDRFKLMFPDSTIAKGYQQSDSKVQKNTPYSFLFDETTNSQVKK